MSIISFIRSLFCQKVSPEKSELSNPDIHIVPYGFYKSHFILLDTINYYSWFGNPEFTGDDLKQYIKYGEKRASELWRMWYINVRVEKIQIPQWWTIKRNYYSINKKWRQALINFNHKF